MSEMIERVARAMARREFLRRYEIPGENTIFCKGRDLLAYEDEHWKEKSDLAKAAIAAMREPTEDMEDAARFDTQGAPAWRDWFHPFIMRTVDGKGVGHSWLGWAWRAMIDAALKE